MFNLGEFCSTDDKEAYIKKYFTEFKGFYSDYHYWVSKSRLREVIANLDIIDISYRLKSLRDSACEVAILLKQDNYLYVATGYANSLVNPMLSVNPTYSLMSIRPVFDLNNFCSLDETEQQSYLAWIISQWGLTYNVAKSHIVDDCKLKLMLLLSDIRPIKELSNKYKTRLVILEQNEKNYMCFIKSVFDRYRILDGYELSSICAMSKQIEE